MIFTITKISKKYVYFQWQGITLRKKIIGHPFKINEKIKLTYFDI